MQTNGLSAAEIADRKAIQAIWVKYWEVTDRVNRTPLSERQQLIESVATGPHVNRILQAALRFDKNGWDNYGVPGHRIYWGPPVDGADVAAIGDCMDFSHSGRLDAKTKVPLTIGISRSNVHGSFQRISGLVWRVSGIQIVSDDSC